MNPNDQVLPALDLSSIDTPPLTTGALTGMPGPVPDPATGAGLPGNTTDDDFVARLILNFGGALDQQIPTSRFRTLIVYNYTPGPASIMDLYAGTVDSPNFLGTIAAQAWKCIPIPSGTAQIHIVMRAADPTNCVVLACAQRMASFSGAT